MATVRNLRSHVFFQPHNQKPIHSDTMNLFYDHSPAGVLKNNAILRTDVIAGLPPIILGCAALSKRRRTL